MYLAFWAIFLIVFDWFPLLLTNTKELFLSHTGHINYNVHSWIQFRTTLQFPDLLYLLLFLRFWEYLLMHQFSLSVASEPFPHLRICLLFKLTTLKLPISKFNHLPYAFSLLFLCFKEIWLPDKSDYWGQEGKRILIQQKVSSYTSSSHLIKII